MSNIFFNWCYLWSKLEPQHVGQHFLLSGGRIPMNVLSSKDSCLDLCHIFQISGFHSVTLGSFCVGYSPTSYTDTHAPSIQIIRNHWETIAIIAPIRTEIIQKWYNQLTSSLGLLMALQSHWPSQSEQVKPPILGYPGAFGNGYHLTLGCSSETVRLVHLHCYMAVHHPQNCGKWYTCCCWTLLAIVEWLLLLLKHWRVN